MTVLLLFCAPWCLGLECGPPKAGDECDNKGRILCNPDYQSALFCADGTKWSSLSPCPNCDHISGEDTLVSCHNGPMDKWYLAVAGARCVGAYDAGSTTKGSCSLDRSNNLVCQNGKWVILAPCIQPMMCKSNPSTKQLGCY